MGWKNLQGWLKWGIIGIVAGIVYYLLTYLIRLFKLIPNYIDFLEIAFDIFAFIIYLNILIYIKLFNITIQTFDFYDPYFLIIEQFNFFVFFATLIEFFVIGTIAGLIVGKIKSRKNKSESKFEK